MYLYRLYNPSKELIYIGKTTEEDVVNRIKSHLACYNSLKLEDLWKDEVKYFDYAELKNEFELAVYEIYYIAKHNPIYNKQYNFACDITLEFDELEFSRKVNLNELGIDLYYYKMKFELARNKYGVDKLTKKISY